MDMTKVHLAAFADEVSQNLDEQIAAMSANGVEYLEVRGVNGKGVASLTPDEAKNVKDKLAAAGLSVWSLGSPAGKSDIKQDFAVEAEQFKHLLETASITGAKCIRLFSFYGTEGKPEYHDEVMLRLSRFVEMAKGSGVVLCHENEKGIYGDIASRCAEIHTAVPELKAVFDPANFIQSGQQTLPAWDMLEKYVYYGHIKDCLENGTVVPPGKGIAHMDQYLPRFFAKGCNVLTLEPHLQEFFGLAGLEAEGEKSKIGMYHFNSSREAFDCAVNSLKDILKGI